MIFVLVKVTDDYYMARRTNVKAKRQEILMSSGKIEKRSMFVCLLKKTAHQIQ
jgi:hypothetical protein